MRSIDLLMNTPTELTSMTVGAFMYGEASARSTKLRRPWISCSNDAIDMLKSTFQATRPSVSRLRTICNRARGLTIQHDVRSGRPDFRQELSVDPESRFMQHRLHHPEFR